MAYTWRPLSTTNAPAARHSLATSPLGARRQPTAHWAGSQMLVWGGIGVNGSVIDGARYDRGAHAWTMLPAVSFPASGTDHCSAWTGREILIYGGGTGPTIEDGLRYNPELNQWSDLPPSPIGGRSQHTAIWTGSKMLISTGAADVGGLSADGASFDPETSTWKMLSTTNAPSARRYHTAVWTGRNMIIWGGDNNLTTSAFNTGAVYDP